MPPKKICIYLASQSARRKELLGKMGVTFRVIPSSYCEVMKRHTVPSRLVIEHAVGKVKLAKIPSGARIVLGADTLVFCRGRALGKPKTLKAAYRMLRGIAGRGHDVYTGIAVLDRDTGKIRTGYCRTKVFMKPLSKLEIIDYFRYVNPMDKAGAYAIQAGPKIISRIKGSYTNVVGLPVELVGKMLRPFAVS